MIAVVEIWGNQFMVQKGDIIEVKKQDVEAGKKMHVKALLVSDLEWKDVKIWSPEIEDSKVEFKVLEQKNEIKWESLKWNQKEGIWEIQDFVHLLLSLR